MQGNASEAINCLQVKYTLERREVFDTDKIKNGIYHVRVGAPGFATIQFSNVEVKPGRALKQDVKLMKNGGEE